MNFKSILAHLDPKADNEAVLETVANLGKRDGARVTLMSVAEDLPRIAQRLLPDGMSDWHDKLAQERSEWLESQTAPLRERGIDVQTRAVVGSTPIELIREALRHDHDLVIKIASGVGEERSPEDHKLLRKCPGAVWLCHTGLPQSRVMAAIDLEPDDEEKSALNRKLLRHAMHVAGAGGAELHVVHAWMVYGEAMLASRMRTDEFHAYSKSLEQALKENFGKLVREQSPAGIKIHRHLIRGTPQQIIPTFVERESIDMVVMGTIGRSGLPGFLVGNTAEHVLNHIHCDLLAVKPEGFVSPITLE